MAAATVEYVVLDGADPTGGGAALDGAHTLVLDRPASVERTYYDTFDGRLARKGMTAVWQDGRLRLADAALAEVAAMDIDRAPERVLPTAWPPGRLRDALVPIVDVRALIALARVRSRVRDGRVLNADGKTVVRVALEEPALVRTGGAARDRHSLQRRLRLIPVRGYDKELGRVRRRLEQGLALTAAAETLQDEAVRAAGGTPGGVSSKLAVSLQRGQRADSAAAVLLTHLLGTIELNLPGTLDDVDSEYLHDLRVAVRRSRSAQRQLKRVFPPEPLDRFRAEFRRLQQITGPTRDLDVQLLEIEELGAQLPQAAGADLRPLHDLLEARRVQERRRMVRALGARRTADLLEDWGAFLEALVTLPEDDRPRAAHPIDEVAGRRIRRVYRRMIDHGSAIDAESPAEALHDLRKTGKELRYLLEFFAALYPREVVKPMIKTLKALQDVLGRHQDRATQIALLRSSRDDLAAMPDGPAALMAVGLLLDHLDRDQAAARDEFADCFAAFAARKQQTLVRETFR
jgi:CHAD domain-containing protein